MRSTSGTCKLQNMRFGRNHTVVDAFVVVFGVVLGVVEGVVVGVLDAVVVDGATGSGARFLFPVVQATG